LAYFAPIFPKSAGTKQKGIAMFGDKTVKRQDCTRRLRMDILTVNVRPKDVTRYGKHATIKASQLTGKVTTVPHWDAPIDKLITQYGVTVHEASTDQEYEYFFGENELTFLDY
jgi:hypothetical protein